MIQIGKLALGLMEVNCYFVRNTGSRECVVIDPGDRFKKIKNYIDENDLDVGDTAHARALRPYRTD